MSTERWNADGEQYRVFADGELVGTCTGVAEAVERFASHACEHCYRYPNPDRRCEHCCRIETWRKGA